MSLIHFRAQHVKYFIYYSFNINLEVIKMREYYLKQSVMSDLGKSRKKIFNLSGNVNEIVKITQNVLLHQHCASMYNIELTNEQLKEPWLRKISEKIELLQSRGFSIIEKDIPIENRIVGICRDFALLTTSLLREVAIPARARCGFASYIEKGKFIDHWISEYWDSCKRRWVMLDSQIDSIQKKEMNICFNTFDLDKTQFLNGAEAWKQCRAGKHNPDIFGIFDWWGYEYLACNLLLDANSMIRKPMQPWDIWQGLKGKAIDLWKENDFELMDDLAYNILNHSPDTLEKFIFNHNDIAVPDDLSMVINNLEVN